MFRYMTRIIIIALVSLSLWAGSALGSQTRKMPDSPTGRKIMPLRDMLQSEDEASLRRFIETHLAAKAREGRSEQELLEMIGGLRKELAGAKMRGALKVGPHSAKLVLVIEKVSGQIYYDYVREHIFKPAGMEHTDSYEMDQPVPNLAIGYTRMEPGDHHETGPLRNNIFMHTVKGGPAGGGYSTVGDMHRFALAILSNKLLNPESTEVLLTGKVDMAPNRSYAYGFGDHREAGHRYHGHNGGAPGINAEFRFFPESGYIYVVLANVDGAAMPVSRFIHEMIVRQ